MNSPLFSKFDANVAIEEIAPDFIPSHNDLIDSLPVDILEESYHETEADRLFAFASSLVKSSFAS